jgi:transcriptional regulator with XRE-family HTH domain
MTLREWATSQNLTQRDLAQRIGVHEITMSRWINGHAIPRRYQMAFIEQMTAGAVRPADFFADVVT